MNKTVKIIIIISAVFFRFCKQRFYACNYDRACRRSKACRKIHAENAFVASTCGGAGSGGDAGSCQTNTRN